MANSKWNGANIDVGHFTAGHNVSPAEFINKHHARITNLHLKDRKINHGPNMHWGEGDTQIKEVLELMKKEKYAFYAGRNRMGRGFLQRVWHAIGAPTQT